MSADASELEVTRGFLAALRRARDIHLGAAGWSDPSAVVGSVRLVERRWVDGVEFEPEHTVPVPATVTNYGPAVQRWACHATVDAAVVGMLGQVVRVGDRLSLRWTAGNDCENDRRVGWHNDSVHVRVLRAGGGFDVLAAYRVGPDGMSRMCREGWQPAGRRTPAGPAWTDTLAGLLERVRAREVLVVADPHQAATLVVPAGAPAVGRVGCARRLDDELFVVDGRWRRLLGRAFVPPAEVVAAGSMAVAAYRQLRADGRYPRDAAALAVGVAA